MSFSSLLVQVFVVVVFVVLTQASTSKDIDHFRNKAHSIPSPYNDKKAKPRYMISPILRVGKRTKWAYNPDIKRYGKLMAFPRVGRGDFSKTWKNDENFGKPIGSNGGMWFGPRLGRVQKRSSADNVEPWIYYIILNGVPFQKQFSTGELETSDELQSTSFKDDESNEESSS